MYFVILELVKNKRLWAILSVFGLLGLVVIVNALIFRVQKVDIHFTNELVYIKHIKTEEKDEYRIRMGDDAWHNSDRLIKISYEGKSARDEKLYIYNDAVKNKGSIGLSGDINCCGVNTSANTNIVSGGNSTLRPVFLILTEKELTLESLIDLERITFDTD